MKHNAARCHLCRHLRHPSSAVCRRALNAALTRQTRSNGENGGNR